MKGPDHTWLTVCAYVAFSLVVIAGLFLSPVAIASDGEQSQTRFPLSYGVEHTGLDCPAPPLPAFADLPSIERLPDPFAWADGSGRMGRRADWRCRRAEIGAQIHHYELGEKPTRPDDFAVDFSEDDQMLRVTMKNEGASYTLTAPISIPEGEGPFPAVIGVGFGTGSLPPDIFTSRNIATIQFQFQEIGDAFSGRIGEPYYEFYRSEAGKYAAWSWGISRIIDGLERAKLDLDLSRIAVTGCSFAGKMALFAGALDERIALTIAQEPGGGGAAAWRVTEALPGDRETLAKTTKSWFRLGFSQFGNAVDKLPFDHHQLMAMVAPRALLVLGNADYEWMAEESNYVSSMAAREVWTALGVPDRFGFSIVSGHPHCMLPESQRPAVIAFVEKFLLGNDSADTDVAQSPYNTDVTPWIPWDTPILD